MKKKGRRWERLRTLALLLRRRVRRRKKRSIRDPCLEFHCLASRRRSTVFISYCWMRRRGLTMTLAVA
jgi:hypothetical protein